MGLPAEVTAASSSHPLLHPSLHVQKFLLFLHSKAWLSNHLQPRCAIINPSRPNTVRYSNTPGFGRSDAISSEHFVHTTKANGDWHKFVPLPHEQVGGARTAKQTLLACTDARVHQELRKALCSGSYLMVIDQERFGNGLINSAFIPF